MSAFSGLGEVRGYRFKNGTWREVSIFPQVEVEIVNPSEWLCVAICNGKEFHAPEPEVAIREALEWFRTR